MEPGDLVILTLNRKSVKEGSIGLIVQHLEGEHFNNFCWFDCIFDGKMHMVPDIALEVINETR